MKLHSLNIFFVICLIATVDRGVQAFSFSISKEIYEDKQILQVSAKDVPNTIAVLKDGTDIKQLNARVLLSAEQQPERIECEAHINKTIGSVILENTQIDKHIFDYIFHTFYNAFNDGVPAQLQKDVPFTVKKEISNIDTFNKESDVWRNCLYALVKLVNSNGIRIIFKVPLLMGMITKSGKYFNIVLDTENFPHFGGKKDLLLEVAYKKMRLAGGDLSDTEIDPENSYVNLAGKNRLAFTSIDWDLRRTLLQLCDKFINHYLDTRRYKMATGILVLNTKNNYKTAIDDRVYGGTWESQEIDLIRFTYDLASSLESKSAKKEVTPIAEPNFWGWLRAKVASWRWW